LGRVAQTIGGLASTWYVSSRWRDRQEEGRLATIMKASAASVALVQRDAEASFCKKNAVSKYQFRIVPARVRPLPAAFLEIGGRAA
jgi:hypothetical protein